ncbi:MAG TPA: peptide ABC transporter substrate-binding protein [Dictyobacter sp.]|jgi:peptide/nickel transport system substrate-binding protein/oligopeptide transport system substrate-binding protein|nr:peptide ABC transporter substrate-binding protein [Dictyobacter sp.]
MQGNKRFRAMTLLPSVLCLVALFMTACGSGEASNVTTKAPENKQVLVSIMAGYGTQDITTYDPALDDDAFSEFAIYPVFTGLVSLNDQGLVEPQLAQSWDISTDKMTYTFHLRPNLKFSDGTPLTASDVAYSINRALSSSLGSPTAPYYLHYIKDAIAYNGGKVKTLIGDSLIVVNPTTIEIKISQPIEFFLDTLTYPCSYVVEPSLIAKYGKNWTAHLSEGGGDGPFKLKSWTHNKEIDLVPNPNYYGPQPQLKELRLPFYQNQDDTYGDYLAGRLDDAVIPLADYSSASKRSDFHKNLLLAINYYTMNYNIAPFNNIDIRQAFALAVNKQQIVSKVWDNSLLATNHIIPQGMPGYDPNLKGPDGTTSLTGDPTKAKQLLQEGMKQAGYSNVSKIPPITLDYASGGSQATQAEVAVLQQDWSDVLGIHVNLSDLPINTLFANESKGAANTMQFYTGPAWIADYPDPEDWTTLQFDQGAAQNGMNYGQNHSTDAAAQQAVQKEMEQADLMQNPTQRLATYDDIEQKLVNDVIWLPMEQQYWSILRKPCVLGWKDNGMNLVLPNDWANIYITNSSSCANATVS